MLSIQNVTRSFGALQVLCGVSLDIAKGEIVCLLGPSGCGKTTLLRIVAGLETADRGDIRLNGQSILDVPIHTRDFGLMFQDFALFPHMNVGQNILFGLRMHHVPTARARTRLQEVLELVGLQGFEKRDVAQLSGGERQRVALARSLAPNPRLLMLDEPLGSVDAALRDRLIADLRDIIKRIGLTAIYVTHDQHEAFAIADRIAVMNAGQIEQADTPPTLYRRPATPFVARFLGLNNIVPVVSRDVEVIQTPLGDFPNHTDADTVLLHPDGLAIASGEMELRKNHSASPNTVQGIKVAICELVFAGDSYRIEVEHESGVRLRLRVPSREIDCLEVGGRVEISVAEDCIVPLKGET
jgi:ABC-type Fe3+/spermidine/putrescine transport system ATPase subunit